MKRPRRKAGEVPTERSVPPWLMAMRAITGTTEYAGSADNPKIMAMADTIAAAYPDMADYCALYTGDDVPWCGLCVAYCMTVGGIRPVYQPPPAPDTDRFLWAEAWASDPEFGQVLAQPRIGCVVVLETGSGHHVTLYESSTDGSIDCRGGNQSDAVNVATYSKDSVVAYVWPREAGDVPAAERRELEEGDAGADVMQVQVVLGVPADGDFGPTTEGAVMGFQSSHGIVSDGVVGEETWEALDELALSVTDGSQDLSPAEVETVGEAVRGSPVYSYNWPDRGRAPAGYVTGMALSYAAAVLLLQRGDRAVEDMAQSDRRDPDTDVLSWYEDELRDLGWSTSQSGVETLRALFALMIGLGMRESSGRYSEGRDQSADNASADTAEAGLFQTSWNIRSCSPTIPPLLDDFDADPNGFLRQFQDGVTPSGSDLQNFGSGDGALYQFLSKYSPEFHVFVTAVGLRHLRQHWGPVNRKEVDLLDEAYEMLGEVEDALGQQPVEPPDRPDRPPVAPPGGGTEPPAEMATVRITIDSEGPVNVIVEGGEGSVGKN